MKETFYLNTNSKNGEASYPISFRNSLKQTLSLTEPSFFYHANEKYTPILLYPGEQVVLTKNGDQFDPEVINNVSRTNELKLLVELVKKTGTVYGFFTNDLYTKKVLLNKSPADLYKIKTATLLTLAKQYQNRLNFLHDAAPKTQLSPFFIRFMENWLLYNYLANACNALRWKPEQEIPASLAAELQKASLSGEKDSLMLVDRYRSFLWQYNVVKANSDKLSGPTRQLAEMQSAVQYFSGPARNYLLFMIARQTVQDTGDTAQQAMTLFYKYCSDNSFIEKINKEKELLQISSQAPADAEFFGKGMKAFTIKEIIEAHRGRLVYIDFWANWCIPCKEEMPASRVLSNFYKNKPIDFLYMAMDGQKTSWENSVSAFPNMLNGSNSFLLLKSFGSAFAKTYNIVEIPRYMLIGKDGQILHARAPRPGAPELKSLINRHINQ